MLDEKSNDWSGAPARMYPIMAMKTYWTMVLKDHEDGVPVVVVVVRDIFFFPSSLLFLYFCSNPIYDIYNDDAMNKKNNSFIYRYRNAMQREKDERATQKTGLINPSHRLYQLHKHRT